MHDHSMLADGDHVLIAVSGGVDSLVLSHVLKIWQAKAPISLQIEAIHLDMGLAPGLGEQVARQLAATGVNHGVIKSDVGPEILTQDGDVCFHCARQRRRQLFELARARGCNKLALGHHKEDIIETFFLNLFYGGNISTMLPSQPLFNGGLTIIRPLAYLAKKDILALANLFGVEPVANPCPQAENSKRMAVRAKLSELYGEEPELKSNIFAALANVRPDYLPHKTRN